MTTTVPRQQAASAKAEKEDIIWQQLVEHVSAANLFGDSKHFVDCPVLRPWEFLVEDWKVVTSGTSNVEELKGFIRRNFGEPGSDLKPVLPTGWREALPSWLQGVQDPELRGLGSSVHGLWKTLCRQVSQTVLDHPDRHTLLPLPYPFIVPGDRFRECYNWDSYWIIRGLIASDLVPAAESLVRNLLHLVDRWGFVPNGARTYYTNRSQPPLLSAMVLTVWDASGDTTLLRDALPRLVAQHQYWTSGNKVVRVRAADAAAVRTGAGANPGPSAGAGCSSSSSRADGSADSAAVCTGEPGELFTLSRYHAELYGPRPESLREDLELVARAGLSGSAAAAVYCDVASAAESGWDFSTRWFVDGDTLASTRTTQIVPADLNAWLYRTERDIAAIAGHLGEAQLQDLYAAIAAQRLRAINTLMWSAPDGCWHDLLLLNGQPNPQPQPTTAPAAAPSDSGTEVYDVLQRQGLYASNWVPLWCGVASGNGPTGRAQPEAAVAGLLASGLIQKGGLLTSLYPSGQQWDAPNAWPPLVHMAIEGMAESGAPGAGEAAADLARSWVQANLAAWKATGHMHEKYNGYEVGGVGGGGEYDPQVGFGWSNGVLLSLLKRYYARP